MVTSANTPRSPKVKPIKLSAFGISVETDNDSVNAALSWLANFKGRLVVVVLMLVFSYSAWKFQDNLSDGICKLTNVLCEDPSSPAKPQVRTYINAIASRSMKLFDLYIESCKRDGGNPECLHKEAAELRREMLQQTIDAESGRWKRADETNSTTLMIEYLKDCQICLAKVDALLAIERTMKPAPDAKTLPVQKLDKKTILANGSNYKALRGYTDPDRPKPDTICESKYSIDRVTIEGDTIVFQSDRFVWSGKINRESGMINIAHEGITPLPRDKTYIRGHYTKAELNNDFCGKGFFTLITPAS